MITNKETPLLNVTSYPKIHKWTTSAIDCYKRGCVCKGCPIYERYFKTKYQGFGMKIAVIESVRKLGLPFELRNRKQIIED